MIMTAPAEKHNGKLSESLTSTTGFSVNYKSLKANMSTLEFSNFYLTKMFLI